jgi:hypothetical protein
MRHDENDGEWTQLQQAITNLNLRYKPTVKPSVVGPRAGNVALKDLLSKLASAGYIIDNTTP